MDPQEKINTLRNKIDDLDNQILDFLVQRFSISREKGSYSNILNNFVNIKTRKYRKLLMQHSGV